ncbi:hypothetical protein MMC11_008519 [Xylographa trunciseda]|nr:hypothetical protein [Xylographa trunciseda]
MAPIRRYLRLTATSAIEVRIYLDNPLDAARWLLSARDPSLPRVLAAVRPLVLPKLREETERARGKGKKKGVKDVVVRDDFDVSIFLTELSTPHGILLRQKVFGGGKGRLGRRGGKMTGTREEPVEVEEGEGGEGEEGLVREESGEEKVRLGDIPAAEESGERAGNEAAGEALFVSDGSEGEDSFQAQKTPPSKRKAGSGSADGDEDGGDDKKKMMLNTTYDGFRIYGRILCLVVKRKGIAKGKLLVGGAGQAMMEEWITSTQMAQGQMQDE